MKTKQLVARSAVTIVATGLTLLSSGTSEAHGRGFSGMRMSGGHGGMNNGAIHQSISNRAMNRGNGISNAVGRNNSSRQVTGGRDDRGGRGERHPGEDRGRGASATARERQPGDDRGHHREPGDHKGGAKAATAGERQPRDDKRHQREPGDDRGLL